MSWNLATDNSTGNLSVYERLFAFAYEYLAAAKLLCAKTIERAEERDWAAGAVVLMNTSHSIELFLKATLLRRDQSTDVWKYGHNITALADEYERCFLGPGYAWEILFRQPKPEGLSAEQQKIHRVGVAPPIIEFRYPVSKQGMPWLTLHGFEPHSFAADLNRIESDFDRIYDLGA